MFIFLMQRGKFRLFDLNLAQLKNSSFVVSMVSFVTFQSVPFFKGIDERLGRIKRFQVGNSCWSTRFPFSSILTFFSYVFHVFHLMLV